MKFKGRQIGRFIFTTQKSLEAARVLVCESDIMDFLEQLKKRKDNAELADMKKDVEGISGIGKENEQISFHEKIRDNSIEKLCCYNSLYYKMRGLECLEGLLDIREMWDELKDFIQNKINEEEELIKQSKSDMIDAVNDNDR